MDLVEYAEQSRLIDERSAQYGLTTWVMVDRQPFKPRRPAICKIILNPNFVKARFIHFSKSLQNLAGDRQGDRIQFCQYAMFATGCYPHAMIDDPENNQTPPSR